LLSLGENLQRGDVGGLQVREDERMFPLGQGLKEPVALRGVKRLAPITSGAGGTKRNPVLEPIAHG
jgi:hypothetical protein